MGNILAIFAIRDIKKAKRDAEEKRQKRYAKDGPPRRTSQDLPTTRRDLYAMEDPAKDLPR